MKKLAFIFILSVVCGCYALDAVYQMVFQNQSPFAIECVGVRLKPAKKYAISNSLPKTSDTLAVDFPQGKGIMPDTLGYILYNPANKKFELKNGAEIMLPSKPNVDNPFWAFSRTADDNSFQSPRYFEADSVIPAATLTGDGIKFNSIVGDKSSRVSIKLFDFAGKTYLKTTSEGIGTKYPLQADSLNKISVFCNQPIKAEQLKIYYFENTTADKCEDIVEILPSSAFYYSYKVLNHNGEIIKSGDVNSDQFEVGDYLFKISAKYTRLDVGLLLTALFILAGFQTFFIYLHAKSVTPPIKSIIAIRLLLNCFALLSIPLYLTALTVTQNRWVYLMLLVFLNASFFTSKRFLHDLNFDLNKWLKAMIWGAVLILPLFMASFAANESLFGVPVLHVQKIIILGLIFVTQGIFLPNYRHENLIRFGLILFYALVLSWITSDIGSFIYTFIAFLLVELVKKSVSIKVLILCFSILAGSVFLLYNISGDAFADRKLYRIVAPYTAPDSETLSRASQADRETYASLELIQKDLIQDTLPEMNKVVIPAAMRSTSFRDFAFFWSLIWGKWIFAGLFFATQILLLYELAFLLFISIRAVRINRTEAFVLPINRESEFVRFLLAFAIVTFTYPVLSNLLLIPLTGQSFPCLSVSLIEIIFLVGFLIPISSVFTNPKYVQSSENIAYGYSDVLKNVRFIASIGLLLFVAALAVKIFDIKNSPDSYEWQKLNKEASDCQIGNTNATDKSALIKKGFAVIEGDNLTSLQNKKKPCLKNLASFYYLNKPYNRVRFESAFYKNTADGIAGQMNIDSVFVTKPKPVSGIRRPFGDVFSYTQLVNGKSRLVYTNDYYASIPPNAESINADLSAELSKKLSEHLSGIGVPGNTGSILIVKNANGGILANSTYPLTAKINSNEIHYNAGSLKKIILAYCALAIDPAYKHKIYNNKSFQDFIKWSDDVYAASLLKDVMLNHEQAFADVLENDFNLPLLSQTEDAYFDRKPDPASYAKPLDKNNEIYRYSIGQQKPYRFIQVLEWYSRIASEKKLQLNYTDSEKYYENLSLSAEEIKFLKEAMNAVLLGTASNVGEALSQNQIQLKGLIAKTGTAESVSKQFNSSSSFVIANNQYTIGVMLNGNIPNNSQGLAAKNLMIPMIPILKKYNVL